MEYLRLAVCLIGVTLLPQVVMADESKEKIELVQNIEDIRISILQRQKVAGFYTAELKVEAAGPEQAEMLHKLMPRIRDAVLVGLSSYLPIIWSRDDEPKQDAMMSLLTEMISSVCPPETIKNIYLTKTDFSLPRR